MTAGRKTGCSLRRTGAASPVHSGAVAPGNELLHSLVPAAPLTRVAATEIVVGDEVQGAGPPVDGLLQNALPIYCLIRRVARLLPVDVPSVAGPAHTGGQSGREGVAGLWRLHTVLLDIAPSHIVAEALHVVATVLVGIRAAGEVHAVHAPARRAARHLHLRKPHSSTKCERSHMAPLPLLALTHVVVDNLRPRPLR